MIFDLFPQITEGPVLRPFSYTYRPFQICRTLQLIQIEVLLGEVHSNRKIAFEKIFMLMMRFALCFTLGKANGLGEFLKTWGQIQHRLILSPLLWECIHPRVGDILKIWDQIQHRLILSPLLWECIHPRVGGRSQNMGPDSAPPSTKSPTLGVHRP